MRFSAILHAMTRCWYVTLAGLMFTTGAALFVFTLIPAQYTSSGIAVLAQSKTAVNTTKKNPLVTGENGLDTETLTLVQALDGPDARLRLGLDPDRETFTIKNVGSATLNAGNSHPFLYISTQSDSPVGAARLVETVMSAAATQLTSRQAALHIAVQFRITLDTVSPPTTPKRVMIKPYAITGAVAALGLILSAVAACAVNALRTRRESRAVTTPSRSAPPAPARPAAPHVPAPLPYSNRQARPAPARRPDHQDRSRRESTAPDGLPDVNWHELGWNDDRQIALVRAMEAEGRRDH